MADFVLYVLPSGLGQFSDAYSGTSHFGVGTFWKKYRTFRIKFAFIFGGFGGMIVIGLIIQENTHIPTQSL